MIHTSSQLPIKLGSRNDHTIYKIPITHTMNIEQQPMNIEQQLQHKMINPIDTEKFNSAEPGTYYFRWSSAGGNIYTITYMTHDKKIGNIRFIIENNKIKLKENEYDSIEAMLDYFKKQYSFKTMQYAEYTQAPDNAPKVRSNPEIFQIPINHMTMDQLLEEQNKHDPSLYDLTGDAVNTKMQENPTCKFIIRKSSKANGSYMIHYYYDENKKIVQSEIPKEKKSKTLPVFLNNDSTKLQMFRDHTFINKSVPVSKILDENNGNRPGAAPKGNKPSAAPKGNKLGAFNGREPGASNGHEPGAPKIPTHEGNQPVNQPGAPKIDHRTPFSNITPLPPASSRKIINPSIISKDNLVKICKLEIPHTIKLNITLYVENADGTFTEYKNLGRFGDTCFYKIGEKHYSVPLENITRLVNEGRVYRKKTKENVQKNCMFGLCIGGKKTRACKRSLRLHTKKRHIKKYRVTKHKKRASTSRKHIRPRRK